ncbi:MAG: tetratricopeptide repeat protein [Cyanobacteria bacterium P01_G01_bin.54]
MVFPRKRVLGAIVSGCILTALIPLATQAENPIICTPDGCITRLCAPRSCYDNTARSRTAVATVRPNDGAIRTTRPTIRWNAIEGVTHYTIIISKPDERPIFAPTTVEASIADIQEFSFPENIPELEWKQTYIVRVVANGTDTELTGEFYVISQERQLALETAEHGRSTFERFALYMELNLYTDSLKLLEDALAVDPQNPNYVLLLGDVYWKSQDLGNAEYQYERVLQQTQEPMLLAQARVGLAKIALDNQESVQALLLLEQALADFQAAGNPLFVAQTLQFIAETQRDQKNLEAAQQFYRQALAAYEALTPTVAFPEDVRNRFIAAIRRELE